MSKHTGGDWLVDPFKARVIEAATGVPICELLWPTKLRSEEETFANAELIARAPELLRSLTEAREALRELADAVHEFDNALMGTLLSKNQSLSWWHVGSRAAAARNLLDANAREGQQ